MKKKVEESESNANMVRTPARQVIGTRLVHRSVSMYLEVENGWEQLERPGCCG